MSANKPKTGRRCDVEPTPDERKPASEGETGHTEAWSLALTWAKAVVS